MIMEIIGEEYIDNENVCYMQPCFVEWKGNLYIHGLILVANLLPKEKRKEKKKHAVTSSVNEETNRSFNVLS